MLDVNKEGVLGKKQAPNMEVYHLQKTNRAKLRIDVLGICMQARDFLRCSGWCLPDDELDTMLVGQVSSSPLEENVSFSSACWKQTNTFIACATCLDRMRSVIFF